PRSAALSTRSAAPYMGDVSKRFAPVPSAISTMMRACCSAAAPRTSKVRQVPMPMVGTSSPVCPNARRSIRLPAELISSRIQPACVSPQTVRREDPCFALFAVDSTQEHRALLFIAHRPARLLGFAALALERAAALARGPAWAAGNTRRLARAQLG